MPNKNKGSEQTTPSDHVEDPGLSKAELDNVSSDSSDDMVSVPKSQLDAMVAKMEEMGRSQDLIQSKLAGGMPQNQDAISRIVTRAERDKFMNTPRPLTEVFCWNPYAFFVLYCGREETDHISGNKKRIPAFLIRGWHQWHGPGSEFPNEHFNKSRRTGPKINMGRLLLHLNPLVQVVQSDIEEFRLPPDTRTQSGVNDVHNKPFYTVRKIVDMLMARDDLGSAIYTGETMRNIIALLYEANDAETLHRDKMVRLIADEKSRSRLKTGQLDDILVEA